MTTAPGAPGLPPTWCSSAKEMVGCSLGHARLRFSIGGGTGRGRAWPLLTGERGHYELSCGRDPLPFLLAMTRMTSMGGMLPEQVWDAAPVSQQPG